MIRGMKLMMLLALAVLSGCASRAQPPSSTSHDLAAPPPTFINSLGERMILVPATTFAMGHDTQFSDDTSQNHPRHTVSLSAYYLAEHEVTKGQFRQFVADTGIGKDLKELDPLDDFDYVIAAGDEYPIHNVSWDTAVAFCKWLSAKEERTYRLPTEAEWECACRAGTDGPVWWTQPMEFMYVHRGTRFDATPHAGLAIPGTYPANPWGFHEMLGNAAEWVQDWYGKEYYLSSPRQDPQGPSIGKPIKGVNRVMGKVVRGGSYQWIEGICHAFSRLPFLPASEGAGFRLACAVDGAGPFPASSVTASAATQPGNRQAAGESSGHPALEVSLAPGVSMTLLRIPAGIGQLGSPLGTVGRGAHEPLQGPVEFPRPFYLGETEVTRPQWHALMGKEPFDGVRPDLPAGRIWWTEAREFCERLTKRERDAGRLPADAEFRMPMGDEWEYAYRAGSTSLYPCGDDASCLASIGWLDQASGPFPVRQKLPNAWGLYDMGGNVWEWCNEGMFGMNGTKRRKVLGSVRQARGGAWNVDAICGRASWYQVFASRGRYDFVGFRLLRTLGSMEQ